MNPMTNLQLLHLFNAVRDLEAEHTQESEEMVGGMAPGGGMDPGKKGARKIRAPRKGKGARKA